MIAVEERTSDPQQLAQLKQAWQQKVRAAATSAAKCAGGLLLDGLLLCSAVQCSLHCAAVLAAVLAAMLAAVLATLC